MASNFLEPHSDEHIEAEVSKQIGRDTKVEKIHISHVKAGDTVFHEGVIRTVCPKDIKYDSFMGRTLRGDSYISGRRLVRRLVMRNGIAA